MTFELGKLGRGLHVKVLLGGMFECRTFVLPKFAILGRFLLYLFTVDGALLLRATMGSNWASSWSLGSSIASTSCQAALLKISTVSNIVKQQIHILDVWLGHCQIHTKFLVVGRNNNLICITTLSCRRATYIIL